MKTFVLLWLAASLALPCALPAAESVVPEIVARGFDQYVKHGTLAAIDAWLAGSVRETDDRYQDEAAARMNAVQSTLGRALGFETVRVVSFSPSTERAYVVVKFEKGVAWMSFDCYKPAEQWIVTRFEFQRNASLVLPATILGGS